MVGPIRISILSDAKNAVAGLDDTGRAADGLGTKFGGLAKSALKYAAAGGALAAGAAVVGLGKLAAGAAEDQQAATLLAKALKNATGATDAQVASVEDYISKVGVAKGVTDDELRPALSKLVTATGSVKKAQDLTNLAMDISAGSGKSLEQVTTALAKANNGSAAGLAKFGIATKDANGEVISFADATGKLGEKFGGAATTKAETLSGKIDRLKLIAAEAGESIGYSVIPVLTKFADLAVQKVAPAVENIAGKISSLIGGFSSAGTAAGPFSGVLSTISAVVTDTIVPALASFAGFVQTKVIPALGQVAGFVATNVVPVLASLAGFVVGSLIPAVLGVAEKVAGNLRPVFDQLADTFTTKVLPTVQTLLGKFQEAQPTLEKIALTVVKVAGKFLEFGAAVLGKVLPVVTQFAGFVISNLVPVIASIVVTLVKVIGKVIDFGGALVDGVAKVIDFAQKVGNKIGDVVGFFADLPGKIKDKFGDAGKILLDIGGNIVEGLKNGISNGAQKVLDAVQGLIDKIPKKIRDFLGIASPSKVTTRLGRYAAQGLAVGLTQGRVDVERAVDGLSRVVASTQLSPIAIGGISATEAWRGASSSGTSSMTIQVRLSADQVDQVSRGRVIQSDLDAYYRVGGRSGGWH